MIQSCVCGEPATFQATRILPGGAVNPRMGVPLGQNEITWWCDEHFAILARDTPYRYTFEQLETTPRKRPIEGQSEWDFG